MTENRDSRFIQPPGQQVEVGFAKAASQRNYVAEALRSRTPRAERITPGPVQDVVITNVRPSEPNLVVGFGKDGAVSVGRSRVSEAGNIATIRSADDQVFNTLSRKALQISCGLDDRAQDIMMVENTGGSDIIAFTTFRYSKNVSHLTRLPGGVSRKNPNAGMSSSTDIPQYTEGRVYMLPLSGSAEETPVGDRQTSVVTEVLVLEAVTDNRRVEGAAFVAYKEPADLRFNGYHKAALEEERMRAEIARQGLKRFT